MGNMLREMSEILVTVLNKRDVHQNHTHQSSNKPKFGSVVLAVGPGVELTCGRQTCSNRGLFKSYKNSHWMNDGERRLDNRSKEQQIMDQ